MCTHMSMILYITYNFETDLLKRFFTYEIKNNAIIINMINIKDISYS